VEQLLPLDLISNCAETAKLVDRSEYKRRQAPPGVKITGRALDGIEDYLLPVFSKNGNITS